MVSVGLLKFFIILMSVECQFNITPNGVSFNKFHKNLLREVCLVCI